MFVAEKIREIAEARPDAPALFYNLEPLSYRGFHSAISRLRTRFEDLGLAPGRAAVVRIDTIAAAWVADLALRSAGLTTVAIRSDDDFSSLGALDVAAIVSYDAEARPALDAAVLPDALRISFGEDDWRAAASFDVAAPAAAAPAGGHILLTSGTTGHYRMLLIEEAFEGWVRGRDFYQSVEGVLHLPRPEDARFNMLFFGLWTIAGYMNPIRLWSVGASIIIHQGPNPHQSLAVPGITHLVAAPAFLMGLLQAPEDAFRRNEELQIIVGGGALATPLAREVKRRIGPRLAIGLGASETGPWALTPVESEEDLHWHRVHPSRTVQVVDEADQPLPPGQLGEVRIRQTPGVAGYLNDEAANRRFFRDGWFYSGDLGVMDERGRLALRGRVTDVLHILGSKHPAEPVELALCEALGVHGVCALSEQGADNAEHLHVVIETPAPIPEDRLTQAAHAHLSGFPAAHFHFVERLPRNHMGKVERLKLKRQLMGEQAPRTDREALTAAGSPGR